MNKNNRIILGIILLFIGLGGIWIVYKDVKSKENINNTKIAKTINDYFNFNLENQKIRVRLALTDLEISKGLMYCKQLDKNEGMLFAFKELSQRCFWMRNVPIPLSIGYFDTNGKLLEIYEMGPFDEITRDSKSDAIRYVLEMPQNWFLQNNINIGSKLDLKEIKNAIKERHFNPGDYNL